MGARDGLASVRFHSGLRLAGAAAGNVQVVAATGRRGFRLVNLPGSGRCRARLAWLGVLGWLGRCAGAAVHLRGRLVSGLPGAAAAGVMGFHAGHGGLRGVGGLVCRVIDGGGTGRGHLVHRAATTLSRRGRRRCLGRGAEREEQEAGERKDEACVGHDDHHRAQTAPTTLAPGAAESRTPGPWRFGSPAPGRRGWRRSVSRG